MTFWTYMLQCSDRLFYVGHTDDLERRIGEHQVGTVRGYSTMRRPVHLVWSSEFPTREEARRVELQLKGWGKLKKLALIRGDWDAISALAKGKKEGASTSSAKPERAEALGPFLLHPHLSRSPSEPFNLEVKARMRTGGLTVRYRLSGPLRILNIPQRRDPARRNSLWQHTCFEVFVRDSGKNYLEYNLAPSTEWAAYGFTAYRAGMADLDIAPPAITTSRSDRTLQLTADLALPPAFAPARIGLSAVIEEAGGAKSYWALAHPPGDAPDFHHPDCFALEVPPAGAA